LILVDFSVWIDCYRGAQTPQMDLLDGMLGRTRLAVGDLIVTEVLQGVRDEREFNLVRKTLGAFAQIDLAGHDIAAKPARNFRALRTQGITVRKTIDSIIATRCIEDGLTLLHNDRDLKCSSRCGT
jgi:hypothetical protein